MNSKKAAVGSPTRSPHFYESWPDELGSRRRPCPVSLDVGLSILVEPKARPRRTHDGESRQHNAQEKLQLRVTGAFANETTDPSVLQEMGEMGLLGLPLPEEYGGLGASYVTYGLLRVKLNASIQVIGQ